MKHDATFSTLHETSFFAQLYSLPTPLAVFTTMTATQKNRIWLTTLVAVIVLAALIGIFWGWPYYRAIYLSGVPENVPQDTYVYIPTGSDFEQVVSILKSQNLIDNERDFRDLAERMKYKRHPMRSGRFLVKAGWSNKELIERLRNGEQAPVKLVFNNERLLENIAAKAARFIEPDSAALMEAFRNRALLEEIGHTEETLISIFIPNTYEVYWNLKPEDLIRRMLREHDTFWSKNERLAKAVNLGLTPLQVYTLASIVERESNYTPERPRIAGVYLNRLAINMKLQADPTCVFATRDFATRRVTEYHLQYNSPYNTYLYKGLPPGPISMASINSIDAVLNRESHNYLFFCAEPNDSGRHFFAETYQQHLVNARKFQEWVSRRGY